MAKINYLSIGSDNKNYVSYNDSDAMTDYFNGYTLNQRETIEWLKKDGADRITVYFTNETIEETLKRGIKKAEKIAKGSGYSLELKTETIRSYRYCNNDEGWKKTTGIFKK